MIEVVGTTHLDSKDDILKIIKDFSPDILGCELCSTRFKIFTNQVSLGSGKDDSLLGQIADETKKKADSEGLDYGSDQKTVMFYAVNNNIPLLLLDMDIMLIRENFSKIPLFEQAYLQKELLKFQSESLKREINEDEVIIRMKNDIPTAYKILVEDRDNHIISGLKEAIVKYSNKRILVFLGKGHVKRIKEALSL